MSDRDQDVLIEAAVTAYRERDVEGRITPPPAWWDLSPEAREELLRRQVVARTVERAVHPSGWSATVQAVMARMSG